MDGTNDDAAGTDPLLADAATGRTIDLGGGRAIRLALDGGLFHARLDYGSGTAERTASAAPGRRAERARMQCVTDLRRVFDDRDAELLARLVRRRERNNARRAAHPEYRAPRTGTVRRSPIPATAPDAPLGEAHDRRLAVLRAAYRRRRDNGNQKEES